MPNSASIDVAEMICLVPTVAVAPLRLVAVDEDGNRVRWPDICSYKLRWDGIDADEKTGA